MVLPLSPRTIGYILQVQLDPRSTNAARQAALRALNQLQTQPGYLDALVAILGDGSFSTVSLPLPPPVVNANNNPPLPPMRADG
jgi:hypothetical protein